jgi:hypothetical protein
MLLAVEASNDERGVSATVKGARTLANAHNSAIKVFTFYYLLAALQDCP